MDNFKTSVGLGVVGVMWFCSSITIAAIIRVPSDYGAIQSAVDAALEGDTILVAAGTYTGVNNRNLSFNGKNLVLNSEQGPAVTILDAEYIGSVLLFQSGETDESIVKGFTITHAYSENGAIYTYYASPCIVDCRIVSNAGDGIQGSGSFVQVYNTVIADNTGNGVSCQSLGVTFMMNCLITGNAGIGIYAYGPGPTLNDCTVTQNGSYGIAVSKCSITITNCIIWEERYVYQPPGEFTITYSDVLGGDPGTGNIDADPLFTSGPEGGYYLSNIEAGQPLTSPCLDTGGNLSETVCYTIDGEVTCLDSLATRSDGVPDSWIVDMGFHYPSAAQPIQAPAITTWGVFCLITSLSWILVTKVRRLY